MSDLSEISRLAMAKAIRNAHAIGPTYTDVARVYSNAGPALKVKEAKPDEFREELKAMHVNDTLRWRLGGVPAQTMRNRAINLMARFSMKIQTRVVEGILEVTRLT